MLSHSKIESNENELNKIDLNKLDIDVNDLFENPKKRELLKKALFAVCEELDAMFEEIEEESRFSRIIQQRYEEDPKTLIEEISKDKEIVEMINKFIQ